MPGINLDEAKKSILTGVGIGVVSGALHGICKGKAASAIAISAGHGGIIGIPVGLCMFGCGNSQPTKKKQASDAHTPNSDSSATPMSESVQKLIVHRRHLRMVR